MAIDELRFKGLEIVRNRGMLSFPCYFLELRRPHANVYKDWRGDIKPPIHNCGLPEAIE